MTPVTSIILAFSAVVGADTVRLHVDDVFQRGVELSPRLEAADRRVTAAGSLLNQAGAWPNPTLAVAAENVGQQQDFTGESGVRGLEGQAVLTLPLPLGWERQAAISGAHARREGAEALAAVADAEVRAAILTGVSHVLRDQALVRSATEELSTLSRFARDLTLRAEQGRGSRGDAARATLARAMAATQKARSEATLAGSRSEMARLLGFEPDQIVEITAGACPARPSLPESTGTLPELQVARSDVAAAEASLLRSRGLRIPDVQPQVGVRRSAGRTGLYLGLATVVPFLDWGGERVQAAREEVLAVQAEERDVSARLAAHRAAASSALDALEDGGAAFDTTWFRALEQTVEASDARYELGEGTLLELLDSRRARRQALDDYHTWQAEWWVARARLARLEGRPVTAGLICLDPFRETP